MPKKKTSLAATLVGEGWSLEECADGPAPLAADVWLCGDTENAFGHGGARGNSGEVQEPAVTR